MSDPGFQYFDVPAATVQSEIDLMNDRADEALNIATAAITALGAVSMLDPLPAPPNITLADLVVPSVVAPTKPSAQIFGKIDPFDDPALDDFSFDEKDLEIDPGDVPEATFAFPDPPPDISTAGAPDRPSLMTVTFPSDPTLNEPPLPPLDDLILPSFDGIDEPIFVDSIPTFGGVLPTGLQYTPAQYNDTLLTQVKSTIALFMQGGTGIPIAVQDALFQAARVREEQTALAAEQGAFDTWAGRNFSMPPGMLVEAVDVVHERTRMAENALSRDILTKAAVWEIENLRHYVAQGVALEGMLMNLFNQIEQRTLDAAKAQSDIEVKVYELAVTLYNVRQTARRIAAEVYKAQWDGQLAKVQAFRAQVDAVVAKGQLNDQRVRVYLGMWEGVKSAAQVFQTRMQASQIQSDTNKVAIEGYLADVQAYQTLLAARKVPVEVYAERMKGEQAKASAFESQVRAFAATVSAQETEANVKIKIIDAKLQATKISIDKYTAKLQFMRDHIQAQLANIQATSSAYVADTGRYREEISGQNQARALTMQTLELRLRNNLEYYATQLREFDAVLGRQIERSKIVVEALKGAGQIGASLAAGAMSAIHVQAAIHGSGSVNANNNNQTTRSISSSIDARVSESYNFSNTEVVPTIPMPQLP